jgi:tetratricopeptide (TPR) repeat protein
MLSRIWDHLVGYERLKLRGDQLFLSGELERARHEYTRARRILGDEDFRSATLDALIRECERADGPPRARTTTDVPDGREEGSFPGSRDLYELAIAEKSDERLAEYRGRGKDFEAGYLALVQGDAERAIRSFQRSRSSGSPSFVELMELGRALSLGGHMDEARTALKEAERLAANDREVLVLLAAVDVELGRFEEAHDILTRLLKTDGGEPEAMFLLGRALAGMNRAQAALDQFHETVKLEPRFHEAFFEAAALLERGGDTEGAFGLLNRACALAPDEIRYNRALAELVLRHDLDEEAGLAACDRLTVTDEENSWEYLHWIAQLYIRRGWRREARDPLLKALELVPANRSRDRLEIEQRLQTL